MADMANEFDTDTESTASASGGLSMIPKKPSVYLGTYCYQTMAMPCGPLPCRTDCELFIAGINGGGQCALKKIALNEAYISLSRELTKR